MSVNLKQVYNAIHDLGREIVMLESPDDGIGIAKEDITAEFLASVTHIDEFFVDFEDANENEQALGVCGQNGDDEEEYRIKILEMKFIDMETDSEYYVKQNVLEDYNKGI